MIPAPKGWNQRLIRHGNVCNPNPYTHHQPTKRLLVVNGVVQDGCEEDVQTLLNAYGMQLIPEHRRTASYYAPPKVDTTIKKVNRPKIVKPKVDELIPISTDDGDSSVEAYITIDQLLLAEEVLQDEYEESARRYDRPDKEVIKRKRAA